MTLLKHEFRQGVKALAVWTAAISFFIVICVFMYPEMKGQMEGVNKLFASMGAFTAAFGMDKLNFGTLIGFYAIECGNILGIGGAFFAALIGISILAKEEKEHTAEFLLTHPVNRSRILTEKLAAVLLQIAVMNAVVFGLTLLSMVLIGESVMWKELTLLHAAYLLVQIELCGICFGISAFLQNGGLGIGIGLAAGMYFLGLVSNISKNAEALKYITPFGYANSADIISDGCLNGKMVMTGMLMMTAGIAAGYWKYCKKDIH